MSECRYQAEPRGAFGLAGGWCSTHDEGWNWCLKETRALLAQRDGELEALRGKISEAEEWLREDEDNCGNCHYAAQMAVAAANDGLASMPAYAPSCDFHEGARRLLSALSDNPESPALTDKEEGE